MESMKILVFFILSSIRQEYVIFARSGIRRILSTYYETLYPNDESHTIRCGILLLLARYGLSGKA